MATAKAASRDAASFSCGRPGGPAGKQTSETAQSTNIHGALSLSTELGSRGTSASLNLPWSLFCEMEMHFQPAESNVLDSVSPWLGDVVGV